MPLLAALDAGRQVISRLPLAEAVATAMAPSRGGSISILSSGPRAAMLSSVASKRLAAWNSLVAQSPLAAAFSAARLTSASLPSTPTTWAPSLAIGKLKLPRPQNRSAMRSPGCGSRSCIERRISRRLMPILTWVKSVGLKAIATPNSGSV